MTDFSKVNIHCSSIGPIMGSVNGKTNYQRWQETITYQETLQTKYDTLGERLQGMKTGANLLAQIEKIKNAVSELDAIKDQVTLSGGAKSHLKKVYGYFKYGKWSAAADKGTKYTNKGTLAESDSIALISRLQGMPYRKNEERVNNEFLTGIPDVFVGKDIYHADYIIDVKSSWDIETFLSNLGKPLCGNYWWQIQGYLAITGAQLGEVSYCLVDTPLSIIAHESKKLLDRLDAVTEEDPIYVEKQKQLVNNLTFGDMPEKDRRLRFLVQRDDEAIQKIYKKVEMCREYMVEIEALHEQGEFLALQPGTEGEDQEEKENESE